MPFANHSPEPDCHRCAEANALGQTCAEPSGRERHAATAAACGCGGE